MSWELSEMAALIVLPVGGTVYTHAILSYVCARADRTTGKGWSSIPTIARTAPCSENTARAELHRLAGWGAIRLDLSEGGGRGRTHRFTVHREWLARHMPKRRNPSPGEPFPAQNPSQGEAFPATKTLHPATETLHPVSLNPSPGEPEPMKEPLKEPPKADAAGRAAPRLRHRPAASPQQDQRSRVVPRASAR
jgi:hypothetical protein